MKQTASSVCVGALVLSSVIPRAWAAHPLVTDDTSTQGRGRSQVELNSDWSRFAGEKGHAAAFTYSYGTTDELDIYGNVPASLATPSGKGDISLGAKWRIWQTERTALALKPEVFFPTGDAMKGLGNGRTSFGVTLLASRVSGNWVWLGNIGVSANRYKVPPFEDARHLLAWRASTAVVYDLNAKWSILADIGIARNIENMGQQNPAYILFGAIYSPHENVDIDIGVKAGLNRTEVDRQVGAGLTVRF